MPTPTYKVDPALYQFATVRQLEILEAIDKHKGQRPAAKALGATYGTVRDAYRSVLKKAALQGYSPAHDLTRPVAPGQMLRGASTLYRRGEAEPVLQWVRTKADDVARQEMMQAAVDAMSEEIVPARPVPAPTVKASDDLCNLVVFSDYHIGMLAWHREGGSNWNLKIAEQLLVDSFAHMVGSAPSAKHCVLCFQGDQQHFDGFAPVTNLHRNVLDADGRLSKIVGVTIRVIRSLVESALAKHESVHLIICEGNHDEVSSLWLRHMFTALYENEPRITVNDSELPFYTHQHGDVMLAFHHGHKVKNEQLPMLFAAQFPQVWGATTKRYCHTGHRHHVDEKEYSGMTVTQHPTLAARDAYAARGGWIAERSAVAVTYHKKFGQVSRTIVCPEMFETA